MDKATRPQWSNPAIRAVNRCRLYLRVIYLSDLTHGHGRMIISTGFFGVKRFSSSLLWPNQGKPSEKDWRIWRQFLRKEFLRQDNTLTLLQPLGAWLIQEARHHRQWDKHRHPNRVCIKRPDGWKLFKFRHQGRYLGTVELTSNLCQPPDFCPVTFDPDTLQECFYRCCNYTLALPQEPGLSLSINPPVLTTVLRNPVDSSCWNWNAQLQ